MGLYMYTTNKTCRCGNFSIALCGDTGCYDPGTGDYDVLIPLDQPLGKCYCFFFLNTTALHVL